MNSHDLKTLRHSAAHLLAHAIKELFPDTILTIGPATEEGFFYDLLPVNNFSQEDLSVIEERMKKLSAANIPLTHRQISKAEARKIFKNNPFKLELIDEIPGDTVGLAEQGVFYDLCRGGHVASTGDIKYFKLLNISGSYWRADKTKQALQRISGTAFFSQKELDDYLKRKEELALYDHRRLGKQLDLFSFHEEGVGFPFFHPKGKVIINLLVDYLRTLQNNYQYKEIATPLLLSDELWKQSGHYTYYKDNMYFCIIDDKRYAIRPMNCPGAFIVYKDSPHSYRELPLRLAEFGLVHRHELSGVLHGLMRVRAFTIDDAHIFCPVNQLESEISTIIDLAFTVYTQFNFNKVKVGLSTKPEKSMGSSHLWQQATDALANALKSCKIDYIVQEGEGAFYGPKIEFVIEDSIGREWQCGTIQVDFFQAENFDLNFINSAGNKEKPVILHRAIYGSLERFFAILLEHYKGNFPFWLAPTQIRILTITDEQKAYAQTIYDQLQQQGIRVELDMSSDPISGKIKTAQLDKIPWMLVLGKKEMAENTVSIRYLDGKQELGIPLPQLLAKVKNENTTANS
jgi:threonyl-tRNA synthetase